jgi:hypothetical protein
MVLLVQSSEKYSVVRSTLALCGQWRLLLSHGSVPSQRSRECLCPTRDAAIPFVSSQRHCDVFPGQTASREPTPHLIQRLVTPLSIQVDPI